MLGIFLPAAGDGVETPIDTILSYWRMTIHVEDFKFELFSSGLTPVLRSIWITQYDSRWFMLVNERLPELSKFQHQ
jgi:hypothetical protein